jgi:hypothetical protein
MCRPTLIATLVLNLFTPFINKAHAQNSKRFAVDTAIYTILPYDSSAMMGMNWHYSNAHAGSLNAMEVDSLEPIVDSAYGAYTRDSTAYLHNLRKLKGYWRQYIALINYNGEKIVWVNFFCADVNGDWKHRVIIVDDGGNCFFQLFINVHLGKAEDLIPNGYAYIRTSHF